MFFVKFSIRGLYQMIFPQTLQRDTWENLVVTKIRVYWTFSKCVEKLKIY